MNAPQRLGVYGAGLVALFVAAFTVAGLVVPKASVAAWSTTVEADAPDAMDMEMGTGPNADVGERAATPGRGLALEQDGLHLIVVRTDGARFRHVHPEMSADGVWSIPWTWDAAGSYRVLTDFVPEANGENVTLGRTVDVGGRMSLEPEGDEPAPGSVSGPEIEFMTEAPTPGRYLLYLDFKVDGVVRTAHFVLDATGRE